MKLIPAPDRDLTLALAGVFQSAALVYQIAKLDRYEESAMYESSYSLIRLNAESIEQVYGSAAGVDLGLRTIVKLFSRRADESTKDIYQYAAGVHQLSMKLAKLPGTSNDIHGELEEIQSRFILNQDGELELDALHEAIADLYSCRISTLTPRIIVQGTSEILQQAASVNRVRTALFAGIRSAYLWHQLGGRRWKLVVSRNGYVQMAHTILNDQRAANMG